MNRSNFLSEEKSDLCSLDGDKTVPVYCKPVLDSYGALNQTICGSGTQASDGQSPDGGDIPLG
jgi:hypothetical protein